MRWTTSRFDLDFGPGAGRVLVMGIVNVTPDSFSDGGTALDPAAALARCERLVRDGAHLLDIGGESTRPGAEPVPADEEWRRILPVLRGALTLGVPVSVDTAKAAVMRAALDAGADIVNDVRALADTGALEALAGHPRAGVVLMHGRGDPRTMNALADYAGVPGGVVGEVRRFLGERLGVAQAAGIAAGRIVLDPGYGFAKTAAHNAELLRGHRELHALGRPLLAGLSRKRSIEAWVGAPRTMAERLPGSLAAALAAVEAGARILRVHDVRETADALAVWRALRDS